MEEFYNLCRKLLSDVEQTVQLAILGDGMNVVYLARHDGREPLHLGLTAEIGRSVPANCTATGKAMLAALENGALEERLRSTDHLIALTDRSISTLEALRQEIQRVRARGYAIDDEETIPGLYCLGIALNTPHRHDGLMAVSFTFRKPTIRKLDMTMVLNQLKAFVKEFAKQISGTMVSDYRN